MGDALRGFSLSVPDVLGLDDPMLNYHGHIFADSCCADQSTALADPTDTHQLRKRFKGDMRHRIIGARLLVRSMITKQDMLGLQAGAMMQIAAPGVALSGTRQEMFARWLETMLNKAVLGNDGSWMRVYLAKGFAKGTQFAQRQIGAVVTHPQSEHRLDALVSLAKIELQGIIQAVLQQSTRAVADGLASNKRPMHIVREVWKVLDKVGVSRANAMIELMVVKAHAMASLDVYQSAGVQGVGLVPESKLKVKTRDAGPGSRLFGRMPSPSTIGRIAKAAKETEALLGENVNVRTAGDDDVCPECEDIADSGPYSINEARSLIPAHPNCRCVFVPADDERFAPDDDGE